MLTIEQCLNAGQNGVMMPNEHYHSLPGISGSKIKLLAESNLHYDNSSILNPETRDCFNLGTHVHSLALEGINNAVTMPKFGTKAETGKTIAEQQAAFEKENAGKMIIDKDDHEKALLMARNVRAICGEIISNGIIERSLFAEYSPGLIIKSRIDCEYEGDDYDLKTITPKGGDMSDFALTRHCNDYGYYESAALRNIVRQALEIQTGYSLLIFVSTSPGHMVKVRKLDPVRIAETENKIHDLLLLRRLYLSTKIDLEIKELR